MNRWKSTLENRKSQDGARESRKTLASNDSEKSTLNCVTGSPIYFHKAEGRKTIIVKTLGQPSNMRFPKQMGHTGHLMEMPNFLDGSQICSRIDGLSRNESNTEVICMPSNSLRMNLVYQDDFFQIYFDYMPLEKSEKKELKTGQVDKKVGTEKKFENTLLETWKIFKKIKFKRKTPEVKNIKKRMLQEMLIQSREKFRVNIELIRTFLHKFFKRQSLFETHKKLNIFEETYVSTLLLKKCFKISDSGDLRFETLQRAGTSKRKEHLIKFLIKRIIKEMNKDPMLHFFGPNNIELRNFLIAMFFERSGKLLTRMAWDSDKKKFVPEKTLRRRSRKDSKSQRKNVGLTESESPSVISNRLVRGVSTILQNEQFRAYLTEEKLSALVFKIYKDYVGYELPNLLNNFICQLNKKFGFDEDYVFKKENPFEMSVNKNKKIIENWKERNRVFCEEDDLKLKNEVLNVERKVATIGEIEEFSEFLINLIERKKLKMPWSFGEFAESHKLLAELVFQ